VPDPVVVFTPTRSSVLTAAERATAKAEARAGGLKAQIKDEKEVAAWRRRGEVLRCAREDAAGKPGDLSLPLLTELIDEVPDGKKSLEENEDLCFKRADKIEKSNARCGPLVDEALAEAARWRNAAASLGDDDDEVGRLHRDLCDGLPGYAKEQHATPPTSDPVALLRRKYGKEIDCFLSPSGHEVIVGRNAAANERVSFELALSNGFWFHADSGVAGSHVAILCAATEVSALEDVEFAAAIAAWHSKARAESSAAVVFCHGGQLARPPIPKLGQVMILGRRGQIHVKPELPAH
jgi:predicted ribosome quality control (RQC) complex YloA/Tae2 family protein